MSQSTVQKEIALSHESFSVAKDALRTLDDETDDDRYKEALTELTGAWNDGTRPDGGDPDEE